MQMDWERIVLEPHQVESLCGLVEKSRSVPPQRRREFIILRSAHGDHLFDNFGFLPPVNTTSTDVIILAKNNLLLAYDEVRRVRFSVTPEGFAYYDYIKQRAGEAVAQVECEVKSFIDSGCFRGKYAKAHAKWQEAQSKLWSSDSESGYTLIGHLCREAMVEFANVLWKAEKADARDPKEAYRGRVKAAIDRSKSRIGGTQAQLLEALWKLWLEVDGLIQKLEHNAQREGEELTWEHARRATFYTLIVMYEIDRAVSDNAGGK